MGLGLGPSDPMYPETCLYTCIHDHLCYNVIYNLEFNVSQRKKFFELCPAPFYLNYVLGMLKKRRLIILTWFVLFPERNGMFIFLSYCFLNMFKLD